MPDTSKTTQLPHELVTAYRSAHFRVDAPSKPFVLRIDEQSPMLAAVYRSYAVDSAAFLTAWNPYSRQATVGENLEADRELKLELHGLGLRWFSGEGADPTGHWPPEPSVLVLGMAEVDAFDLATRFQQNGFVWCGLDAVARLILTR